MINHLKKTLKTRGSDYILDSFGETLNRVKNPNQKNKWYVRKFW